MISTFGMLKFNVCVHFIQEIQESDIQNVVLSYLVHNCFKETVDSFVSCSGMSRPADCLEDMEKRKSRLSVNFLMLCVN